MLDDLCLPSRAGVTIANTGIDSLQFCRDRAHYLAYRDHIEYRFNSRGFRDSEWPQDLASAIWCVGDSYTVGIGQPFDQIWPQQLAKIAGHRTINVSMDGASNAWIARRAAQIMQVVRPKIMILHWSFLHRREDSNDTVTDELRRIWHSRDEGDIEEFRRCVVLTEENKGLTCLIHSCVPLFSPNPIVRSVFLRRVVGDRAMHELQLQDHGRDGFHYGPKTTSQLVQDILEKINMQDVDTLMAP